MLLKRKKSREYEKYRKSNKYSSLLKTYKVELKKAKKHFYNLKIKHLKASNSKMWYKNLKKLLKYDQKEDKLEVESIKHLPDEEQAELIAQKFAEVSNEYQALNRDEINIPMLHKNEIPKTSEDEVKEILDNMKLNKSERVNDIPAKVFKKSSKLLSKPLTKLINLCIESGTWPNFLKVEIVSAIPKTSNPKMLMI